MYLCNIYIGWIKFIILLMCRITQGFPFGFYWDFLTLYPWTICQHSRAQGRCVGRGHLTATCNSSGECRWQLDNLTTTHRHIVASWPAPPHAFPRRSPMCAALPSPSYAVSDRRLKLGFGEKIVEFQYIQVFFPIFTYIEHPILIHNIS